MVINHLLSISQTTLGKKKKTTTKNQNHEHNGLKEDNTEEKAFFTIVK